VTLHGKRRWPKDEQAMSILSESIRYLNHMQAHPRDKTAMLAIRKFATWVRDLMFPNILVDRGAYYPNALPDWRDPSTYYITAKGGLA